MVQVFAEKSAFHEAAASIFIPPTIYLPTDFAGEIAPFLDYALEPI